MYILLCAISVYLSFNRFQFSIVHADFLYFYTWILSGQSLLFPSRPKNDTYREPILIDVDVVFQKNRQL